MENHKENRKEHWEHDRKTKANRREAVENMREENHRQQEHVGKGWENSGKS